MKNLKKGSAASGMISSEPEVFVVPISEMTPKAMFLVSDGVTCALSDKELAELYADNVALSNNELAQVIIQTAMDRGSRDNVSCVVVSTRAMIATKTPSART